MYGWGIVLATGRRFAGCGGLTGGAACGHYLTMAAESGRLDELTARTMQFAGRVMGLMRGLPGVGQPGLARFDTEEHGGDAGTVSRGVAGVVFAGISGGSGAAFGFPVRIRE